MYPARSTPVRERLIRDFDQAFYEEVRGGILFAIAVDSIECWLLPLVFDSDDQKAKATKNCVDRVNLKLGKHGYTIGGRAKNYKYYDRASQDYRKPKILAAQGPRNPSLALFLQELKKLDDGAPV